MNISQLHYFVVAAQFEHFGMAAKSLYITQPALSNSISRLEKELGVKLFDHIGRNVKLTAAGELFLKHASRSLSELDEGMRLVMSEGSSTVSTIRIGAVAAVLRGYLSSLISSCGLAIEGSIVPDIYQKGSTKDCIAGLTNGTLDIAFCGYPVSDQELKWVPLVPQNAVATLSIEHPLANKHCVSLAEIRDYPLLSYREPSYMYYAFKNMFKQYGLEPRDAFEDEISALSVIAANKDSIGIMLDTIKDVIWGAIKMLHIREFDSPYHYVGMVYKANMPYSDDIQAFIAYVTEISNSLDFDEPIERRYY